MPADGKHDLASARREAGASVTRRHIVEAARRLFLEQGYVATSIRQLADAAEVSPQTIYNAFGSKFGVFSALIDVVVAGDHEDVALMARPEMQALETISEAPALIGALVRASVPVLSRLSVVHPVLVGAAAADTEVAVAYQRFAVEGRLADLRPIGERLVAIGGLARDMDPSRVTDILWTVLSPEVFVLLHRQRAWTAEQFEVWAIEALVGSLTAPGR